jgi:hypothetical protein
VAIATRVLELSEIDDYVGILNIASPSEEAKVNRQSPISVLRKYYLKLSLIIHPDRMGKTFPEATKAFQALVKAFESLSSPELIEEVTTKGGKNAKKVVAIARSNDGCFRTRVCCPRCKQPWNEGTLDGNPEYCYNFLMTGLKRYTCSTCLCEFGCMTALHKCPFCKKGFEYSPLQYHNKIVCGNLKCTKPFGFMMYHASDRVIKDMKQSVKEEQERFMKAREVKLRRAKRGHGDQDKKTAENAFMMGLNDICPRCGEDFTEIGDEDEQRRHLMECTDEAKHKEHSKKMAKKEAVKLTKEEREEAQVAAQTHASWQFLGANKSQLWLLNEDQLRAQALIANLDVSGDKDDLISRIVSHEGAASGPVASSSSVPLLTMKESNPASGKRKRGAASTGSSALVVCGANAGDGAGAGAGTEKSSSSSALVRKMARSDASAGDIPSNYQAYSAAQLRSMCASQGLLGLLPKNAVKLDMINVLEKTIYQIDDE